LKKLINFLLSSFLICNAYTQNVGIGTATPTEKLEVSGNIKATGLAITQGNQYDVVKKGASNLLVFSKGSKAVGINYIIAITGIFPNQVGSNVTYPDLIMGEIRLFAGNFPPKNFMLCNGQLLPINSYLALFSIIGTTYGGDGSTNFALPDLRGAVPVGSGTPVTGAAWSRGEVN
jgi:microcystin-dependent protein